MAGKFCAMLSRWCGKLEAMRGASAAATRSFMRSVRAPSILGREHLARETLSVSTPWSVRAACAHTDRLGSMRSSCGERLTKPQALAGARGLARGGGKAKGGGGNSEGKKGKGKGKPDKPLSCQAQLHRALSKEMQCEVEDMATRNWKPLPPPGWSCVDIDEWINRGDEGMIVLRGNFAGHRVDIVASPQLIEAEPEEVMDEDDEPVEEGASAAVLVCITKPGRGKPLVFECLANPGSPTCNGLAVARVSVGIHAGVFASEMHGPVTPLYVTYSALWEDEVMGAAGILAHELAPEASDHDPLDAARAELTDDPSAVTSPDLFELEPELQEAFHDLVNAAVSEPVLSYVLDALAEADQANYVNFLSASSEWVKP